jgi:chromosome partitioning protein
MARKIAIAIRKGGVGKTTTAKNLAAAIAARGHRVLLVDLDEQANATKGLGADPTTLTGTLNDLFADPERDPASVIVQTGINDLHLLPGHPDLAKTETGMALQRANPTAPDPIGSLKAILGPLDAVYDFMVFDTPPAINYMTINGLAAADELLLPAAASAYTDGGVTETLAEFERARKTYNPALRLCGILITRVKRTNASSAVLNSVRTEYAELVLPQAIVESTAVDEAEQLMQPVVVYDPENVAAQGYSRVAELLTRGGARGQ